MIHPKMIIYLAQSSQSSLNGCVDNKHLGQNEIMSHSTWWGGTLIKWKTGVEESERKVFSVVYMFTVQSESKWLGRQHLATVFHWLSGYVSAVHFK